MHPPGEARYNGRLVRQQRLGHEDDESKGHELRTWDGLPEVVNNLVHARKN
jgi:hypothetical protein